LCHTEVTITDFIDFDSGIDEYRANLYAILTRRQTSSATGCTCSCAKDTFRQRRDRKGNGVAPVADVVL